MLDYTSKDFDSLRAQLFALIQAQWPKWTDTAVTNFGNILVDLFAHVGDILCFYQDSQANESRWTTAQQRRNLLALAKLIGYVPDGAVAAQTSLTLAATGLTADCTIPAGQIVRTNGPTQTEFQLLASVTLTVATPSTSVLAEHSRNRTESFTSDLSANQELTLSWSPFLDNSLTITAADGAYTQVADLLSSAATDRHFVISVDDQDLATVRFGNGVSGAIPTGTIVCSYRTGGGAAGNVDAGTLTKIDGTFVDLNGTPVVVTATNAAAATGGADRETKEQIRANAPASLRATTRTVAHEDFLANGRVAGVERIAHLTRDDDGAIPENESYLYIVPTGLGWPTGPDTNPATLLGEVRTAVTTTYPCMVTHVVHAVSAQYLDVDVAATIYLRAGAVAATVKAAVEAALAAYFALTDSTGADNALMDFGANLEEPEIPLSDLINAVRDATGVRKVATASSGFLVTATRETSGGAPVVVLSGVHQDVTVALRDFPRLGTVTLTDGDTGLVIP